MGDDQLLTPEAIRVAKDTEYATVSIPEWGGHVRLRGLTGGERDRYEATILDDRGRGTRVTLKDARARLVVMAAVDANGDPLFKTKDAIVMLSTKSARALNRLWDKARELSGMTEQDIVDMVGNSDGAPGDDSPSDSQPSSE